MFRKMAQTMFAAWLCSSTVIYAQKLTELAFIKTTGSVLAVQAVDKLLYFSENQGGAFAFWSVDVSRPKSVLLDSFRTAGFNVDFDIAGGYAYLAIADVARGIRILNVNNPADIKNVKLMEIGEPTGTFYQDQQLHVAAGGLVVFDAKDAENPTLLWDYDTDNMYGDAIDISVRNDLAYVNVHNTGLFIINKGSRTLEGIFSSSQIGVGIAATESYAYISDAARGFVAIDVRDPQKPIAVDSLTGSALGGGIVVAGKTAYWADGENGLRVIDISNSLDLRERTRFQQDSLFAFRAALKDSSIYLASGSLDGGGNVVNGVHILRNDFATGVREPIAPSPTVFELRQNHPNPYGRLPFNQQTTISYRLSRSSLVRLEIFNLLGQKIKTLVDGAQPSGDYRAPWDGRDHRGEAVTSGVYLYRLTIDGVTQTRRMLFLR